MKKAITAMLTTIALGVVLSSQAVASPRSVVEIEKRGCCSHHKGVCGCSEHQTTCCDGTTSPTCTC